MYIFLCLIKNSKGIYFINFIKEGEKVRNKILISSTSALAGMAVGYMLKKTKNNLTNVPEDDYRYFNQTVDNAGKPDEIDSLEKEQLENAKMVSEGSQFGVQYYNELRDVNMVDDDFTIS